VADLPAQFGTTDRPIASAVVGVLLDSLVERHDERILLGGTANLVRFGHAFEPSVRPMLEALEEHVVLLRLLGEATDDGSVTVRIGHENEHAALALSSVVAAGYGPSGDALAKLGVVGPTRMDYPGAMSAVRAVARYVGRILAGS
jgi:heat-inducible transcriptional repressor